ncbi:MAG: GTP-binding protein [Ferruginibacter sp.]
MPQIIPGKPSMHLPLLQKALGGDHKALARCISMLENEAEGYEELLESLPDSAVPVTGITGPPGAGKSTITDALISLFTEDHKKVAVLCIDPSSPFHSGALLGDRIRMSRWFDTPTVFIRSLAGKNSLGGLSPKVIEITDLLKAAVFDHIIIETIGVGQNEIEISGLADNTVVVLVPEGGDEVQTMKAGLMEIADIFVVNKADRPGADIYMKNLRGMLAPAFSAKLSEIPVLKTNAVKGEGIAELYEAITQREGMHSPEDKARLFAQKAHLLIAKERMKDIDVSLLQEEIYAMLLKKDFNLYRYLKKFKAVAGRNE